MSARRPLTVVLAAGGTGGHVFPAVAAAEALLARGHKVVVATDGRGRRFEGAVETATIAAGGLSGGLLKKFTDAVRIGVGVGQAMALLKRVRADVVVGFGGYPSLPTMLAAQLLRRPTVLHDQNAVLGRVNRLFVDRVDRVATAFADVAGAPAGRATLVGNPVRREVAAVADTPYRAPAGRIGLLVFGGSQGASVFARVLPEAIAHLPEDLRARLRVTQQAREAEVSEVEAAYAAFLQRLAAAGAEIVEISWGGLDFGRARRAGLLRSEADAALAYADDLAETPERFSADVRPLLDYGRDLPAPKLAAADRTIRETGRRVCASFAAVNVVALPTTPMPPFPFNGPHPPNQADFAAPANFAGCPALSLPAGATADGLPIGMQLLGPVGADYRLIALAAEIAATG